jgi:hypothetical protein
MRMDCVVNSYRGVDRKEVPVLLPCFLGKRKDRALLRNRCRSSICNGKNLTTRTEGHFFASRVGEGGSMVGIRIKDNRGIVPCVNLMEGNILPIYMNLRGDFYNICMIGVLDAPKNRDGSPVEFLKTAIMENKVAFFSFPVAACLEKTAIDGSKRPNAAHKMRESLAPYGLPKAMDEVKSAFGWVHR